MVLASCLSPAWGAGADGAGAAVPVGMEDPLDASAWAARHGDAAVLALLREDQPPAVQLRAIEAARWLVDPERSLPPLGALAAGRDPRVAPAAAVVAWEIARALDPRDLAAREVEIATLRAGREAFESVEADATVRPDLARLAAFTGVELSALTPDRQRSARAPTSPRAAQSPRR